MKASLEMRFQMTKGSDEEFSAVLRALRELGGSDEESWPGLREDSHGFTVGNGVFSGLWGRDYLQTDPEPYLRFARAAPHAAWTASSDRCNERTGVRSRDRAAYADGILRYEFSDYESGQVMDYDEMREYVGEIEESLERDTERIRYEAEDEDGENAPDGELTLRRLQNCFFGLSAEVKKLFQNHGSAKKAVFLTDGCSVCLYKEIVPGKFRCVVPEYFGGGAKPESMDEKTFAVTGRLTYFDNADALAAYVTYNGGYVSGSLSKKTDYLVCGEGDTASAKAKKAAGQGVPVLSEREFIARFGFPDKTAEDYIEAGLAVPERLGGWSWF